MSGGMEKYMKLRLVEPLRVPQGGGGEEVVDSLLQPQLKARQLVRFPYGLQKRTK